MPDSPIAGALRDEDAGGIREAAHELIEPPDLASGQPAGARGDDLFGLVPGEVAGGVEEHLPYADGLAHRGVGNDPGLLKSLRLFGAAFARDLRGANQYVAVEVFPRRTQVDERRVVAKAALPDRAALRGPRD